MRKEEFIIFPSIIILMEIFGRYYLETFIIIIIIR
jgi:hypothetical protein